MSMLPDSSMELTTEGQLLVDAKEAADWNRRFAYCQAARLTYEEQWYTNLAFYLGKQWVVWQRVAATNTTRLIEPPAASNRVRLIINKIRPIIRRELTKLTKEEPIFYVSPKTTEPEDVAASRCAEGLSQYILEESKLKNRRRKATFWTCITGTGFLKITCPGLDQAMIMEAISPWHIFVPDLQTEDLEDQPYVIHARGVTQEKVQSAYGVRVTPKATVSGSQLEQKLFTALGIKQDASAHQRLVYLKEIWIKPGNFPEYPEGGMLVMAEDKIIYRYKFDPSNEAPPPVEVTNGEVQVGLEELIQNPFLQEPKIKRTNYPYMHGMFPFVKISHIPAGRFYSVSVIEDLISLQREVNKTRSQHIEIKNRVAKPAMTYGKGSINPKMVTSEPGVMIAVNPGFDPPKYMDSPVISPIFTEEVEMLYRDMDDSSSQFEVTRGSTPPGVEAASAIAYLQEENDSILHETIASIEEAMEITGRQCLLNAQQFWTQEKIVDIVSKNNTTDATIFKSGDLRGNTDLKIEAGSIAPVSRAAKQAFITGLIKDGIIPPEKGLRYLQMNETNRLYDELQVDSKQAQRENYAMTHQGGITSLPVNPWDNHEIHIYEHGLFMKSQEFELLDMNMKSVVVNHWLQHKQAGDLDVRRQLQLGAPPDQSGAGPIPGQQQLPVG